MNPIKLSKKITICIFIFSSAAFFYSQILVWGNYFNRAHVNYFDASYRLGLAESYFALLQHAKAEEEFLKAIRLDRTNPLVHYKLANFYASYPDGTKLSQAHNEYRKAILYSERDFQLKILEEIYKNHTQDYLLLREIVPKTDRTIYVFAEFLRDKKIYSEAILEFGQAIRLGSKTRNNEILAGSYNWIGIIYMWQGKFDEAVKNFDMASALTENNAHKSWVFRNLGNAYMNMGNLEKAKEAYEKAIKKDPKKGINYYGLGNVYEKMGLTARAHRYYQMAMKFGLDEYTKSQIFKKLELLKD